MNNHIPLSYGACFERQTSNSANILDITSEGNKNKAQQKFHPLKPLNYGQFKFSKLWVKLCVTTGEGYKYITKYRA